MYFMTDTVPQNNDKWKNVRKMCHISYEVGAVFILKFQQQISEPVFKSMNQFIFHSVSQDVTSFLKQVSQFSIL